ncbi:hypothetical protein [Paractinoplanes toevensis]|uniref:Uncharacterized protein n=1 Tax=Paractinoplanes toevensis TaxID=571911 RepID=A0A919T768_9ACTN|nr:hypothetical protein [Actinoplanes toevensis]GIM90118.1 hypothetical protein Ato02nite_019110 [Actinoplanes toevensis]
MSDTPRPAATASQKVVTAMWSMQQPATAKQIAEAASLGYSTVTPILRALLADQQATKTEADGRTQWHLTASSTSDHDRNAPTRAGSSVAPDDAEPPSADTAATDLPKSPETTDTEQPDDTADAAKASTDDPGDGNTDEPPVQTGTVATQIDAAAPADGAEPPQDDTEPRRDDDRPAGTRAYRKPTQPRREKGALRAAVLKVLTDEPDRGFKVDEIRRAIDAAAPDGTNKAGAGAVANAATKLVNDGLAVQVEATHATYQAAPPAAETD